MSRPALSSHSGPRTSLHRRLTAVAAAAATSLLLLAGTTPASAQSIDPDVGLSSDLSSVETQVPFEGALPVRFDLRAGISAGINPEIAPPGANDWSCKPTPEHPRPVVLINPTLTTQALAWQAGSPFLKNNGYCVFTFNYGNVTPVAGAPFQALGDIPESAQKLSDVVDNVLAATGAEQVDLVGHSQGGGILPDYYLSQLGGAEKVHTKVAISPSTGTTLSEIMWLRSLIPVLGPFVWGSLDMNSSALTQQTLDSPVRLQVYPHGTVAVPGVQYYSIVSEYDEVVTPFTNQYYSGDNAVNIHLQDGCPADLSEHVSTMYSERAWLHVRNALDPEHAQPVPCFRVAPFIPTVT